MAEVAAQGSRRGARVPADPAQAAPPVLGERPGEAFDLVAQMRELGFGLLLAWFLRR